MSISQVHEWNSLVSFALALPLNLVLLWLLFRRTPKEMRVFGRILTQTVVVDLLLTVMSEIAQPVFFTDGDVSVFVLNGPFVREIASPGIRIGVFLLWNVCINSSMLGLCVQFLLRYLGIVRRISISLCQYLLMLGCLLCVVLLLSVFLFLGGFPPQQKALIRDAPIGELLFGANHSGAVLAAIYAAPNGWNSASGIYGLVASVASYVVIICCARGMIQHVRQNATKATTGEQKRAVQMQREITRSLILLASTPLALQSINVFLALASIFAGNSSGALSSEKLLLTLQMLSVAPTHWLPVFNPICTILTVKPYRQAVTMSLRKIAPTSTLGTTMVH